LTLTAEKTIEREGLMATPERAGSLCNNNSRVAKIDGNGMLTTVGAQPRVGTPTAGTLVTAGTTETLEALKVGRTSTAVVTASTATATGKIPWISTAVKTKRPQQD